VNKKLPMLVKTAVVILVMVQCGEPIVKHLLIELRIETDWG
jgi:hypothetical protein